MEAGCGRDVDECPEAFCRYRHSSRHEGRREPRPCPPVWCRAGTGYRSSSWEAATSPGLCARRAHLFPPQQRDRDDRRRLDWPNVARDRERREHQRALQRRPYSSFSGPVTLATGVAADDIGVVTALPNGQIGVLWSNQNTRLFGFRVHSDGADPSVWSTDEQPASQSALDVGLGMADDHLNVAVAPTAPSMRP